MALCTVMFIPPILFDFGWLAAYGCYWALGPGKAMHRNGCRSKKPTTTS